MDLQSIWEQGVLGFLFIVYLFYNTKQTEVRERKYLEIINKLQENLYVSIREIKEELEVIKNVK